MGEHTKGPWTYRRSSTNGNNFIYAGNQKEPIAGVLRFVSDDEGAEGDANARLIAAAPDLLAVLQEIMDGCIGYPPSHVDAHKNRTKEQIYQIAKAAIAKAEGE